jgi:hypothetical protein
MSQGDPAVALVHAVTAQLSRGKMDVIIEPFPPLSRFRQSWAALGGLFRINFSLYALLWLGGG